MIEVTTNCTNDKASAHACYLIERKHRMVPDQWRVVGEFVAGSPWRDGRPVNDETMREEAKGYMWTWIRYAARVRCPNGEILSDNASVMTQPKQPETHTQCGAVETKNER